MPQLNDYRSISHHSAALDCFRTRNVAARGAKPPRQARRGTAYRQAAASGLVLAAMLGAWMQSVLA